MLYDYKKEDERPIRLVLENGLAVEGEFIDLRISVETLPQGKTWYHLRHADDDDTELATIKNGCVAVNFFGTLICEPVNGIRDNEEFVITEWSFPD